MSLQLFVNRDYENNLIYFINEKYYDAVTLTAYQFPQGNSPARLEKLLEWTPEQIQTISSRPLYVLTHNKWVIFGVQANGSLIIIAQSGSIDNDERVVDATVFKLPDLSSVRENKIYELPKHDFPIEIFEKFVYLINNGMRLNEFNNALPSIGVLPSDIPHPVHGLPGGSVGLSDLVASGSHVNPYAPVSIRPSAETTMSPPGSPTYDGEEKPAINHGMRTPHSPSLPFPTQQKLMSVPNAPTRCHGTRNVNENGNRNRNRITNSGPVPLPVFIDLSSPPIRLRTKEMTRNEFINGPTLYGSRRKPQITTNTTNQYALVGPTPHKPQLDRAFTLAGPSPLHPDQVFSHNGPIEPYCEQIFTLVGFAPQPETSSVVSPIKTGSQPSQNDLIHQQSYETLMKVLYGIPITLPSSLTINGLRYEFIDFTRASKILGENRIERFILDPILQPWAGHPSLPNRIVTLFGKNGISYLVKAAYNPDNGHIYHPV